MEENKVACNYKEMYKQVVQLTKNYEIENIFDSLQQIEKTLGYSSGNIAQVCNKKRISAYGYIWRYVDE